MQTRDAIEAYMTDCEYKGLAQKTKEAYLWALRKLQADFQKLPETPEQVKQFLIKRKMPSQHSNTDLWRNLRIFFNWLADEGLHPDPMTRVNPFTGSRKLAVRAPVITQQLPATFDQDDIERIFRLSHPARDRRERAMISVTLDIGVRLGELASLSRQGIRQQETRVRGKRGERTLPPLSPETRQLLIGVGDANHLWLNRRTRRPLTISGIQKALRNLMWRLGYTDPKLAYPNVWRHTFARLYIMRGGDQFSLQRIMGHRKLSTTNIYVNMNTRDITEQHARYSPMRGIVAIADYREERLN